MMGIVSDTDLDNELERLKNPEEPKARAVVLPINRGRGNTNEVPESLRKIISETAIEGSSAKSIIDAFGVSQSSISAYKKGATSTATYNQPDKDLAKNNEVVREKITKRATKRIMLAMKHITEDKLANAKLRDVSSVAKDMSAVVKNMQPNQDNAGNTFNNKPTYIIYSPRIRKEDEYEVVEAVNE